MKKSPPETLPPKLEAVLVRLGLAVSLNTTQAVKLPYLVDVVANHLLGVPITEGHHEAWEQGVVTNEAWHFLTKCVNSPVIHAESKQWSEERRVVVDADQETVLSAEERAIVDAVAEAFAFERAVDLGRMTKIMNPTVARWGSNQLADLGEDAYDRLSDQYLEMAQTVSKLTLDQLRRDYEVVTDIEDAIA